MELQVRTGLGGAALGWVELQMGHVWTVLQVGIGLGGAAGGDLAGLCCRWGLGWVELVWWGCRWGLAWVEVHWAGWCCRWGLGWTVLQVGTELG